MIEERSFSIEKVLSREVYDTAVILVCRAGLLGAVTLSIEAVSSSTFRLLLSHGSLPRPRASDIIGEMTARKLDVEQRDGRTVVDAGGARLEVISEPWHIRLIDGSGRVITETVDEDRMLTGQEYVPASGFSARTDTAGRPWVVRWAPERTRLSLLFGADERVWGCGERFTPLEKRGQRIEIWNSNARGARSELSYRNVPFYLSGYGYGLYLDNTERATFDFGTGSTRSIVVDAEADQLDCYLIAGATPAAILKEYARLTGRPEPVPKWALGLWISGCFDHDIDRRKVEEQTATIRELEIPCDVYHFDCFWLRNNHWSDLAWDEARFPQPAEMLAELKSHGFKACVWENTYVSIFSEMYEEGCRKGYFLKAADGEPYVTNTWLSTQPATAVVDVTNPEAVAWYQARHRELMQMGVDAFKTDFGEEIPPDARYHNGRDGRTMHNLYSMLYQKMVFDVVKETNGRGLIWARSGCAGSKRFPIHWSGDPECTFEDMAAVLRAGLSDSTMGHALWSHDIGGFYGEPTKELYVRWAQFGLLSPAARCHSQTPRFPWSFDKETLDIFRTYTRLRYRLIPYLYSLLLEAVETGMPVARPMFLEFPDDPTCAALDLQYMLGQSLLVAPVFNREGRVTFYLPGGRWTHLVTGETLPGARWIRRTLPLDVVPIYVRRDALLPMGEQVNFVGERTDDEVTIYSYVDGVHQTVFRDDAGNVELEASREGSSFVFQASRKGMWHLHLPGDAEPSSVSSERALPHLDAPAKGEGDAGYWEDDEGLHLRFHGTRCAVSW